MSRWGSSPPPPILVHNCGDELSADELRAQAGADVLIMQGPKIVANAIIREIVAYD